MIFIKAPFTFFNKNFFLKKRQTQQDVIVSNVNKINQKQPFKAKNNFRVNISKSPKVSKITKHKTFRLLFNNLRRSKKPHLTFSKNTYNTLSKTPLCTPNKYILNLLNTQSTNFKLQNFNIYRSSKQNSKKKTIMNTYYKFFQNNKIFNSGRSDTDINFLQNIKTFKTDKPKNKLKHYLTVKTLLLWTNLFMFRNTKLPFKSSLRNYYSTLPNIFISNSLSDKVRNSSVFFTKNTSSNNHNYFALKTKVFKSIHFFKKLQNNYPSRYCYQNENFPRHGIKFFFKTKTIYNFIKSYGSGYAPAFLKKHNNPYNKLRREGTVYLLNVSKINYIYPLLKKISAVKTRNTPNSFSKKQQLLKLKNSTRTFNKLGVNLEHKVQGNSKTIISNTTLTNLSYSNKSIVLRQELPNNTGSRSVGTQTNVSILVSLKKILNFKFLLIDRFFKKSYANNTILRGSKQKLIPIIKNKYNQNHFLSNNQNLTLSYYKYLNPKRFSLERHLNTYNQLTSTLIRSSVFKNAQNTHTQLFNQTTVNLQVNKLYSNKTILTTILYNPFLINLFEINNKISVQSLPYYKEVSLLNI
jgi:hypothetical protein